MGFVLYSHESVVNSEQTVFFIWLNQAVLELKICFTAVFNFEILQNVFDRHYM